MKKLIIFISVILSTNLLLANDLEKDLLNAMKTYKVPVVGMH